jgi:hypothetical protein
VWGAGVLDVLKLGTIDWIESNACALSSASLCFSTHSCGTVASNSTGTLSGTGIDTGSNPGSGSTDTQPSAGDNNNFN